MMYDGEEYVSKNSPTARKSLTSSAGRLEPYQRVDTWDKNHFWENDSHSEAGKQVWRDFLKQIKHKNRLRANGKNINESQNIFK